MSNISTNDFSVRIIGVESRLDNIRQTQKALNIPDENIFIDYEHDGLIPNAKRAWLKETDKPYTMVLQDDIELCDDFMHYCTIIVNKFPDCIISLFPLQFMHVSDITNAPVDILDTPYYTMNVISGCGIIMPTQYIQRCINYWSDTINGDDVNINRWAQHNNIQVITTIPSLIQHIGDDSVFTPGNSIRRTDFFRKECHNANWWNGNLCSWTNIVR